MRLPPPLMFIALLATLMRWGVPGRAYRDMVVLDNFALFVNVVICYAGALIVLLSMDYLRRTGTGRNVTFPSRAYSVNGERRSYALLRPIADNSSQDHVRDAILHAYADFEAQAAIAS